MSTKPVILAANVSGTVPSRDGIWVIAIELKPCARLRKRLYQKTNTNKSSFERLSVTTS